MTIRKILTEPDPFLRQISLDVKKVDDLHYLLLKKGMQGAQIVVE